MRGDEGRECSLLIASRFLVEAQALKWSVTLFTSVCLSDFLFQPLSFSSFSIFFCLRISLLSGTACFLLVYLILGFSLFLFCLLVSHAKCTFLEV